MIRNLPKEKRDRLILVCLGTAVLLALVYFFLIRPQYQAIAQLGAQTNSLRNTLQSMEESIRSADKYAIELHDTVDALSQAESDIAFGDPNAWIYETLRNFKGREKVDFSVAGQSAIGDVDVLPHFPYKQLRVTITGTAFYHDLGKFISDFENTFPHARILNLNLEPAGGSGDDSEKLTLRMEIVVLVKSNVTQN